MFLSSNDPFKLKRPIVASVYIKTTRFEAWLDFADSSESAISYTKHLESPNRIPHAKKNNWRRHF